MSPARKQADAFEKLRECAWSLHRLVANNTRDRGTKVQVTISSKETDGFWEVLQAVKASPSVLEYGAHPDMSGDLTVYGVNFKFMRSKENANT